MTDEPKDTKKISKIGSDKLTPKQRNFVNELVKGKVKSIKVAIKDPKIVTFFDDKELLFLSYTDANESLVSGYLNPIYNGSDINIYQKKGKKFLKGKESVNSLDIAFPPRYSDDIKYFISLATQLQLMLNFQKSQY